MNVTQLVIQELRQTRSHVERTAAEHGEVEGWRVVPAATSSDASLSIYIGHCTGDMPLLLNGALSSAIAWDLERVARDFQGTSGGADG